MIQHWNISVWGILNVKISNVVFAALHNDHRRTANKFIIN